MSENKAEKVFGVISRILLFLLVCVGLAFSYQYGFNKNNYVTQEELEQQFGGYDDLEEYLEEVFLRDLAEDLEDELYEIKNKIEELENQEYQILYGEFIGINSYGDKSYHVILVNGIELETIGDKNYTFVMSEKVIVLILGGTLYSIPLREVN